MASMPTEVVRAGGDAGAIMDCPLPQNYWAAFIRREDEGVFAAEEADRDVRVSLRVGAVPLPVIAPDEVLVAVMASAGNYNTPVRSSAVNAVRTRRADCLCSVPSGGRPA